jgi:4-hydroxy-3-polyprenylbenzoate decarboxylase
MTDYDIREYLQRLDKAGQYRRVEGRVEAELEVGAIAQRLAERGGPACHFTDVTGAADGATLVGGTLSRGDRHLWAKLAVALGLTPDAPHRDLLDEVVKRREAPIRPMQVKNGACKENVLKGADVDLGRLLAPRIHGGDAARCISSWGFTIVEEPGSNRVVWDVLPHRVIGRNEMITELPTESAIGALFYRRYEPAGQPMPFAVVLGGPPLLTLAASFRLRRGTASPADIAGGLQRAPLQIVRAEQSGLGVPATAEMIIEGVVHPGRRAAAPNFPNVFGYRAPEQHPQPVWEVTAISFRNAPVLPFASWGVPVTEAHIARSIDCDSQLRAEFIRRGTPVSGVYTPPWLAGAAVVVASKMIYTAFSQSLAGIVRSTEPTRSVPYIFACDDDVDVTNPVTVFHALGTKCHPHRDMWQIHETLALGCEPFLSAAERRQQGQARGAAALFDCSWPLDWDRSIAVPPRVSFDQCYPKALQEQVLAEWSTALGFPPEKDRPAAGV